MRAAAQFIVVALTFFVLACGLASQTTAGGPCCRKGCQKCEVTESSQECHCHCRCRRVICSHPPHGAVVPTMVAPMMTPMFGMPVASFGAPMPTTNNVFGGADDQLGDLLLELLQKNGGALGGAKEEKPLGASISADCEKRLAALEKRVDTLEDNVRGLTDRLEATVGIVSRHDQDIKNLKAQCGGK